MSTGIKDNVFAITGGASGMGLATARELALRGAKAVCIGDFSEANFGSVVKELSALNSGKTSIEVTKVDVSEPKSVRAWISGIVAKFGALDGAFNAAGLPQGPAGGDVPSILTEDEAIWKRIIDVNLSGIYFSCKEQVTAMTSLPRRPRAIVNVSSMAPFMHIGCMFAYGASKSGVQHLSENLAVNLRDFGIRVNSVCPGLTETPMQKVFVPDGEGADLIPVVPKTITAKDVADTVVWLLSNDAPQVAGVHIPIGPGMP
ncbi:hypothetical protein N7490_008266 [Penicillium lividum]|nr:hypothetical protein N7490_008266 [Penicillium lividum]